jgi:hypothetical protein
MTPEQRREIAMKVSRIDVESDNFPMIYATGYISSYILH